MILDGIGFIVRSFRAQLRTAQEAFVPTLVSTGPRSKERGPFVGSSRRPEAAVSWFQSAVAIYGTGRLRPLRTASWPGSKVGAWRNARGQLVLDG